MEPSFAIILPTHQRPHEAIRALRSVYAQTYTTWRCLIIIDDIVTNYSELITLTLGDERVTIIQNTQNLGKNASVNRAFETIAQGDFAGYVVFLDDDDWLAPHCLEDFATLSKSSSQHHWFVSNRVNDETNHPYTFNRTERTAIAYHADCLAFRRFGGDATHCIDFSLVTQVRFPHRIKNAEEWLYFAEVANVIPHFLYQDVTGTLSKGYSAAGLTDLYHENAEGKQNLLPLWRELWERKLLHPYVLLYLVVRTLRSIVR